MKHILTLSICLVLLSGCFGEKKGGNNPPVAGAIDGDVFLEQLEGNPVTAKSRVIASFDPLKKRGISRRRALYSAVTSLDSLPDVTECATSEVKRDANVAVGKHLNVGELTLGLYENGQASTLLTVPKDADNNYKREFSESPDAGDHLLAVSGSKDAFGFQVPIPMPYEFANADVNGVLFTTPGKDPAIVQKSADLELTWDIPTSTNYNGLVLEVDTLAGGVEMLMTCKAAEKNLPQSSGKVHWVIPAAKMAQLSASTDAFVRLTRYQATQAESAKIGKVFLAGVRTQVNTATVNE